MTSVRETLVEAKLWCEYRLQQDADYRLRTDELRPRRNLLYLFEDEPYRPYEEACRSYIRQLPEVSSVIEEVIVRRSVLVYELGLTKTIQVPLGGRLLCYCPSMSTSDLNALVLSEGLFDRDDDPGWDSWIHYAIDRRSTAAFLNRKGPDTLDAVVCWIPDAFLRRVEQALTWNLDLSFEWLADSDRDDRDELMRIFE